MNTNEIICEYYSKESIDYDSNKVNLYYIIVPTWNPIVQNMLKIKTTSFNWRLCKDSGYCMVLCNESQIPRNYLTENFDKYKSSEYGIFFLGKVKDVADQKVEKLLIEGLKALKNGNQRMVC